MVGFDLVAADAKTRVLGENPSPHSAERRFLGQKIREQKPSAVELVRHLADAGSSLPGTTACPD